MNSDSKWKWFDKYRKKGFFLALIWSVSVSIFVWNIIRINRYYEEKDRIENAERIKSFVDSHRSELKQILKERNRLYDHVASTSIGILKVEEILNQLAKKDGLYISHIEKEEILRGSSIRFRISCSGSIKGFIKMLSCLFVEYPFVRIEHVSIKFVDNKDGKYEIKCIYNYTIKQN